MKYKILMITAMLAVIMVTAGIAAATEPTLVSILNAKYGSNYVLQPGAEFYFDPGIYTTTTIYVNITDHQAGNPDAVGHYNISTNTKTPLWSNPMPGLTTTIDNSVGKFGLYIDSGPIGGYNTYYTESSKNPIPAEQHIKIFKITNKENTWAIAYEDLPLTQSDFDYNDLVVEVSGADLIPEFPTVALPVAAVLGIVFFFHSRKNKKE